jgi:hypothetical protein
MIKLNSRGFTFIEIAITFLILSIVGAMAIRVSGPAMDRIEAAMNKQTIVRANRIFMSSFYRELKMMAPPQEGVATYLEIALPDQIRWQRYVRGEFITLEYAVSGDEITRRVYQDGAWGATKPVLKNVNAAETGFIYKDSLDADIADPPNNRPDVRIVRINLHQENGDALFVTRRDIYLENLRD